MNWLAGKMVVSWFLVILFVALPSFLSNYGINSLNFLMQPLITFAVLCFTGLIWCYKKMGSTYGFVGFGFTITLLAFVITYGIY